MKTSTRVVRIRSAVKAGGLTTQHNRAVRVRSAVRAGGLNQQHNRRVG
jgi:RNA 3'-terminal phosphate cyclase